MKSLNHFNSILKSFKSDGVTSVVSASISCFSKFRVVRSTLSRVETLVTKKLFSNSHYFKSSSLWGLSTNAFVADKSKDLPLMSMLLLHAHFHYDSDPDSGFHFHGGLSHGGTILLKHSRHTNSSRYSRISSVLHPFIHFSLIFTLFQ